MKIIAAAVLAAVVAVSPAAAQEVTRTRTVTRHVVTRTGPRYRTHRVCTVRYRHGQRIRTCRTVRY